MTDQTRTQRRRARLDTLAKANGFDTWAKLETAALSGAVFIIRPTPPRKNKPGATTGAGKG